MHIFPGIAQSGESLTTIARPPEGECMEVKDKEADHYAGSKMYIEWPLHLERACLLADRGQMMQRKQCLVYRCTLVLKHALAYAPKVYVYLPRRSRPIGDCEFQLV